VAEPAGAAAEMIATMARSEFPGASEVARVITALRVGPQHPDICSPSCGCKQVAHNKGAEFPPCPVCKKPVTWTLVQATK
jgi:hypothetical protein